MREDESGSFIDMNEFRNLTKKWYQSYLEKKDELTRRDKESKEMLKNIVSEFKSF